MFRAIRAVFLLLAILVLSAPARADSSPECNNRVFDSTGKIDVGSVKAALNTLSSDGADPLVRVVTKSQFNDAGNLDKYTGNMLHKCPSWQSPGGKLKNNLLVLVIAPELDPTDNLIGIYFSKYGPLAGALQGQTAAVRSEMSNKIKSDPTASLKAGIDALHRKLSMKSAVGAGTVNGNVTVINKAAEKPTNFTPLYIILFLCVIGAIVFLYFRKQSAKAKARGAQQEAQSLRGQCNNLILGFDTTLSQLGSLLNSYKNLMHTSEFTALQTRLGAIQTSLTSAKAQFTNMQGSANDPDSVGRTTEEYEAMTRELTRSLSTLTDLRGDVQGLDSAVRKIKSLKDGAQPAIDAVTSEIEIATTAINAERVLRTDGPKATLSQAINLAERAGQELIDKRYQAVADTCKEATTLAQKAAQQVRELGARKSKVDSAIQQLDAEPLPSGKLMAVDATITTLRNTYGDSAVSQAQESRATIIQSTEQRRQALMGAKSASTLQNWDLAEQQVAAAKNASSAIDGAVARINGIGPDIERQKAAAAREAERRSRPQSYGSRGRSYSSRTVVTTVIYSRDTYGNPLDQWGNIIAAELLVDAIERSEWDSMERQRDLDRDYGRSSSRDYSSRDDDDRRSSSRDDDNGIGGDSGSSAFDDDDGIGGDSGGSSSDDSFGGGSDD